jgi:hypothetical protein
LRSTPEPNPIWPETQVFDNFDHFDRDEILPERENWNSSKVKVWIPPNPVILSKKVGLTS